MKCLYFVGLLPSLSLAAIGDRCNPGGNKEGSPTDSYGVCIKTSDCKNAGGTTTNNNCPNDPKNVKCCTVFNCGPWNDGDCMWTQDKLCEEFNGRWLNRECPGPTNFKCCVQAHNQKRFANTLAA